LLFPLLLRFLAITFAIIRVVWQQAIAASPVIALSLRFLAQTLAFVAGKDGVAASCRPDARTPYSFRDDTRGKKCHVY
jgi:hypothetical protein